MSENHGQPLGAAHFAAHSNARRRSVPPRSRAPVPTSQHQRWRERPRCPALRMTPGRRDGVVHAIVGRAACRCLCAQFVPDERAARVHIFVSGFCRNKTTDESNGNRSRVYAVFPEEAPRLRTQILVSHHRVLDAGAVLSAVNALRFASTRPLAGPSGIDDASARHALGSYAMVVSVSIAQTIAQMRLTRESRRRMLASSRQCRTALPPFAPRANGARIRSAPTGHDIERNPQTSQTDARLPRSGSSPRLLSCEPRYLSRRILLRITRRAEGAFTSGIALPGFD